MSTLTASHGLTLSSTGLKLIKAYEGYRPVDRTLVTGQRVVGYGHRLFDEAPAQLSKTEAENLLKADLQPFEDMINENVHAPLSQGQFDALVSFAYNIGPKAFLASDTLRALNNGRPLDAANGLDIWRKSTIDGKTYVVDALMRRRTAEKALFLRLDKKPRPASAVDLPPVKDDSVADLKTEDGFPIFSKDPASGIVAKAPYEAEPTPMRRREDGPAGILTLSEIVESSDLIESEGDFQINQDSSKREQDQGSQPREISSSEGASDGEEKETRNPNTSVIAEAAADISERLDALIDRARDEDISESQNWPESLIQGQTRENSTVADSSPSDLTDDATSEDSNEDNLVVFPKVATEAEAKDRKNEVTRPRRVPTKAEIEAAIFEGTEAEEQKQIKTGDLGSLAEETKRSNADSASRYIERYAPSDEKVDGSSNLGFWLIMLSGFILLGSSVAGMFKGVETLLGEYGPLLLLSGLIIGTMMIFGAIYYALRRAFS